MNKNDIKLLVVIMVVIMVLLLYITLQKKEAQLAYVYHGNDLLLSIDLSIDNVYTVDGDNGTVIIEVINHQIRVNEENSPYHLCSKQGFISSSGESIICLPNRIVIEISGEEIDTQVK